MSEFMWRYGEGWSFSDPAGRVEAVLSVIPLGGEWKDFESAPAGEPDDDHLRARIIARLAAENAALRECVRAADRLVNCDVMPRGEWAEKIDYFAARAKVEQ